jgi:hypothetical protein
MTLLRRLFFGRIGPDVSSAAIIQPIMTAIGVFTFIAGVLYLPTLAPSRVEMIGLLLLLALFAMMSHAVGQIAVIVERLNRREDKSPEA